MIPFRLALYVLVLFVCWIPNIVVYSYVENIGRNQPEVLLIFANGLLALQGFFDCIVYGMTNKEFRSPYSGFFGFLRGVFSPVLLPYTVIVWAYRKYKRNGSENIDATSPLLREDTRF